MLEHVGLYMGLAIYTALGAKVPAMATTMCQVFQMLENPAEMDTLLTFQSLLVTRRELFLASVVNESRNSANYQERIERHLEEYEVKFQ